MLKDQINRSIKKAVDFLSDKPNNKPLFGYQTVFPAIMVLESLGKIDIPSSVGLKTNLVKILLKEISAQGSFNYWCRDSDKYLKEPYPDDLDDTCLGWAAIKNHSKQYLNGRNLAQIIRVLTANEVRVGGPYETWCVPKDLRKKWHSIDLAVNCNIGYLLSLFDVKLDNLIKLVEQSILKNNFQSTFYKDKLIVIYFISRFYKGKATKRLKNLLLKESNKQVITAQNFALIISSLINLGYEKDVKSDWIEQIIKKQNNDGSWDKEDLYFYPNPDGQFIGFKEVTTGLIGESLQLYLNLDLCCETNGHCPEKDIIKVAGDYFPSKYKPSSEIKKLIKKTAADNKFSYIAPLKVFNSLGVFQKKLVGKKVLIQGCLINLFGWCAYSIIDNIVDEKKKTKKLPVALILIYTIQKIIDDLRIPKIKEFKNLAKKLFIRMENANYWELNYGLIGRYHQKRYPYKIIGDKSLPHVLGPLIILWSIKTSRVDINRFLTYYRNLLTARQMIDDLEDCFSDWNKGKINSVNHNLIKYRKEKEASFWKVDVIKICQRIQNILQKAKINLSEVEIIQDKSELVSLIENYADVVKNIKDSRQNMLKFLSEYYS